jgi:cell division protein FtsI (penicillin-binding protein 3)
LLRRPSQWFEIDVATISFGQGISVTPLQLARATLALANGGYLMSAPLVSKVIDREGNVLEKNEPKVVRQVVSPLSAQQVQEMMSLVSEEGGTGTLSSVPGFKVAGKTGTAQKVDPVTGGYSADKRVSSFVGFVPAKNPRLVILAVVDEPEGVTYGGLVAAPIFARIADQTLRYLKVSPTHPVVASALPALLDMPQDPPEAIAQEGEEPPTSETGEVIATMPDCLGMSYRQVIQSMGRTGLNIKLNGRGRVVEQSPAAGQAITFGHEVWVRLAPPS